MGKPRIVLVYPKTGWDVKNVTALLPLSVLYLVRPLKAAGFDVSIVDQRIDPSWEERLSDLVRDARTVACGISAMTGEQIRWGIKAAQIARKRQGLPIVWGGIHASLLPEQTLQSGWADVVVCGEGEATAPELMTALMENRNLSDVPSIAFLRDGQGVKTGIRPFIDLDDALIPDYDAVDVKDYLTTQTLGIRDLAVTTSRGCPNRCSYCYNVPYNRRQWRAQSSEAVAGHIRLIHDRFGVKGILIKDDNFFVSRKRVEAIAEKIGDLASEIAIRGECRADAIADHWEPEFLPFLARHGFREMTVGAESGSDETLALLCKDITVETIRKANRRLKEAKIAVKFTFMTGYPNEGQEQVRQTLRLMLDLVAENPFARVTPLHLYAPYPGTALYEDAVRHGYRPPKTLAEWADVSFHNADLPWLPRAFCRQLERASVATYFLDGRTVPEYFSRSWLMQILAKLYGALIRWRARRFFFSWMPELTLLEWARGRSMRRGGRAAAGRK